MKRLRLDLACGKRCCPGFVGVDICHDTDAFWVHDLREIPWPWENESVAEVICQHFFEHLTGLERISFMGELWRILELGAKATLICPHWSSVRSVMDPTHQWPPIAAESFLYFNRSWRIREKLDHYPIACNFTFEFEHIYGTAEFRTDDERENASQFYNNVIDDIKVILTKRVATEVIPC